MANGSYSACTGMELVEVADWTERTPVREERLMLGAKILKLGVPANKGDENINVNK